MSLRQFILFMSSDAEVKDDLHRNESIRKVPIELTFEGDFSVLVLCALCSAVKPL